MQGARWTLAAALVTGLAGCSLPQADAGSSATLTRPVALESQGNASPDSGSQDSGSLATAPDGSLAVTPAPPPLAQTETAPGPDTMTGSATSPTPSATRAPARTATPARATAADPWAPGTCRRPAGLRTTLDPELTRRFTLAQAGAKKAGYRLTLTSGWRDWDAQAAIYAQKVRALGSPAAARRWALPPQESSHVQGLAIDAGNEAAARWLQRHGARYGLCQAYANEWWHFEKGPGVGVACPAPIPSAASLPKAPCP